MKEKYRIWYVFHTVLTVVILLIPFFFFMILAPNNAFEPTTKIGNLLGAVGGLIGLIGSLSIGVGFVNIFMALIKQYLGHIVTLAAIAGGIVLNLLGWLVFSFVR